MAENRTDIRSIFLEAFFVVLGVVLALGANEWRQARNETQRTEKAVASIREEIRVNQQMVRSSLDYHLAIMDTLRSISMKERETGERITPPATLFNRGFIHPTDLVTTSWDLAMSTDALGNLDYETALALSQIYDKYRDYMQQQDLVGELLYKTLFEQGFFGVLTNYQNLGNILGTFSYVECELLDVVEKRSSLIGDLSTDDSLATPEVCQYMRR